MTLGRVLATLIGAAVLGWGIAEASNFRGAANWWVEYTTRQRNMFGRFWGPSYDLESTRWLGVCTALVGVLILGIAILD